MLLCFLPTGCPILILFFVIGHIQTNSKVSSGGKLKENYVSVNFMKINVSRGKIQISAPAEEQILYIVLVSRLFANWHRSAGQLISPHTAWGLAVA